MKYVIMCGGHYEQFIVPRQLLKCCGERIVDRTIRLLEKCGVKREDIEISTENPVFESCGVQLLYNKKNYYEVSPTGNIDDGYWVNCFARTEAPTTYLFGDVFYSEDCIKQIVEAETTDIIFFSTAKPFARNYVKSHVEPLAFKVYDWRRFYGAIEDCKRLYDAGKFWRHPIAFDVWAVLKGLPTEIDVFKKQTADVFGEGFHAIYDYTCDVDRISDIQAIEKALNYRP